MPLIESSEKFGLVKSRYTESFGGLLQMKDEDEDDLLDLSSHEDASRILQELDIDPALRFLPLVATDQAVLRNTVSDCSGGVPRQCLGPDDQATGTGASERLGLGLGTSQVDGGGREEYLSMTPKTNLHSATIVSFLCKQVSLIDI